MAVGLSSAWLVLTDDEIDRLRHQAVGVHSPVEKTVTIILHPCHKLTILIYPSLLEGGLESSVRDSERNAAPGNFN